MMSHPNIDSKRRRERQSRNAEREHNGPRKTSRQDRRRAFEEQRPYIQDWTNLSEHAIDEFIASRVGVTVFTTCGAAAFATACMFDICDITNRSTILVNSYEFFFLGHDEFNISGDHCGEWYAAAALRTGRAGVRLKGEVSKVRSAKIQADKLLVESIRKELSLGKNLDTLRNQVAQFPDW